ncbi:MAG TPA: transglutaminase-like domain-containing protein, partial [Thermoanaerobaculia bacterium]|nr:transglutaminase-like domain-containing protein [Thermoanaerobaculia bacterium]
ITWTNLPFGAFLVALEDKATTDVERAMLILDELTERVARHGTPSDPPVFRLGHLHAEMFDTDGFRGDSENYYDARNAYLDDVLDRRRGLPISLSIVFLHVATRIGLNGTGVGVPGHYITKVQFELNEVYVDPFNGGATMTRGEVVAQMRVAREHLQSWDARQTLMRVNANLMNIWTRNGDAKKAAAARDRMALLDV